MDQTNVQLQGSNTKHSFLQTMARYPDLHRPVFTTLNEPLNERTPRRMALLENLKASVFVTACNNLASISGNVLYGMGYRVVEPSILFNVGECPNQEPHEDGEVLSNARPTLSVIINPLTTSQGVWIARRSHLGDHSFMERISIPGGHAVFFRHDTCHAGMACASETRMARVHLNLVHNSDPRENPSFAEVVVATLRGEGGHRIGLGNNGDFSHVIHLVNRTNEEPAQLPDIEEQELQNQETQEAGQRKRNIATSVIEDMLQTTRADADAIRATVTELQNQTNIVNARLEEARRLVRELEEQARACQGRVDAEAERLDASMSRVKGFEAALELVLRE
jgi:hypothetical protein